MDTDGQATLDPGALQALLDVLTRRGYRPVGPTLRDGAIVYDDITSLADLPRGWTDEQAPGRYRLVERGDGALFGYAVGPHSWKRFLHPPVQRLWRARRDGGELEVHPEPPADERLAFIGVRACELHAIRIQDRVFLGGTHVDPHYRARREACLLVAVNCTTPGGTCFCASMGTGPRVAGGFDLVLTEISVAGEHLLLAEAGTGAGRELLAELPRRETTADELATAEAAVARTAASLGRRMRSDDLHALLTGNPEHPRWDEVGARCVSCGNCTAVCPTCFCTSVEDSTDLTGAESTRTRRWDSCFTLDFSYLHGGSVRSSTRARYRQWMTHKLATWYDQFGTSGCVGCGRCITWCPVGIDITEEARAIREAAAPEGGNDGD